MLQLFFTVAFSAVPLTLYVPPLRSLNPFVETMEELLSESRSYTNRVYPRVRHLWVRILDCLLCSTRCDEELVFGVCGGVVSLPAG
ncbi:hypothetical protein Pyn_01931 [Prunus yedoensis var. nudiflora]|uniref:Secreted protein n=1 Tax=Prunus yedoensis var. nudiflora TaxID=2094558 RepID=A0A314XQL6_PRUYE|nr:hypothetical protein Pyn_01931 [Prunus yedoensis var. nudiflora]